MRTLASRRTTTRPLARKIVRLWLVLLLATLAVRTTLAEKPPANLKILTWNIQMLPTLGDFASPDLQKKQALRAPWIIEFLGAQDYDVVVLQEVIDRKITAQLKEGLKARYPYIVAADSKRGIAGASGGNLMVSRIPLKYVTHTVYKNVAGVDALAEKGCLLAEGEKAGVRFQVVGTHLQAGHNDIKEKEFGEIYEGAIKPYQVEGVPQFLAGDMNVASDRESEKTRYELLLNTTQMRGFPTDDPRPFTVDPNNSWKGPGQRPQKIDHVLLNPRGTQTTIVRQTIQRARHDHEGQPMDLADHYGVIAEAVLQK